MEQPHRMIVGNGTFACECGAKCQEELWSYQNGMVWYVTHLEQSLAQAKERIAYLESLLSKM